jgi:modulator of FtsH protease
MSAGWETTINTGNPQQDQATIQAWQQQVAAQGMTLQVSPMPQGGYHVRAVPMGAAPPPPTPMGAPQPNQYGAPMPAQSSQGGYGGAFGGLPQQSAQQSNYGAPAVSGGVFAAAGAAMGGAAAQPWNAGAAAGIAPSQNMGIERVHYLRKVYGLLAGSAAVALGVGGLVTSGVFGTEQVPTNVGTIEVPSMVFAMLQNPVLMLVAFGVLFASTFVASWVSKVKVVNVVALFGVAALMGVQLAPMVWIAMIKGELGMAASASPVRDAGIMTLSVFAGITGYVFVTKKDFSYMRGFLSMASMALFAVCLLTFVFQSEVFSLAVAGVGALITMAMLLYVTSYIFRNSEMDDPVGDALALLVELRNLFMFLLRLFMSSRD